MCIFVVVLCILLSSYVYLLYYVCIAVFTLDAGLLGRSQYSEGPATDHLDTGFSCLEANAEMVPEILSCHYIFSSNPTDLHILVTNFIFCIYVKQPLPPGDNPIALNKYYYYYYYYHYNIIIISFMRGIYAYTLETNYVPRKYNVAAILLLLFMVLISLVSVLNLLYFYISNHYYYYYLNFGCSNK